MTNSMPNKEIIDATQDAVLNAATNVVNAIETTANELSGHNEPIYLTAEFWVAMAFVLAVVALVRPVGRMFAKMLRTRAKNISKKISEAVELKEEAQKLLAEYERKYRGAKKEAAEIVARSEREIEMIKRDALAKLEADMAIKERDATARLKNAESEATKEIVEKTTDVTLSAVKKILNDSLDDKALSQLIDVSIENLKKMA
ncbi:MAG: hypothetical protein E7017_05305 [Alphaproteobacteria bacterium]|nr:hypothetical protein [Alphaproteobacteria bacterium]